FSLNAMLRIADGTGGRMVPIRDFYLGPGKVDLHRGDVLTHIVIPGKDYQGYHGFYIKYSMRNAMDIATLSCSVVSRIDPLKKVLEDVRITFGVAAPVPYPVCEDGRGAEGYGNWRRAVSEGGRAGKGKKSIPEIPGVLLRRSDCRLAEKSRNAR
ncbi:MAG: hypothetical protein ACLS61_21725, partial [Ruminococcus sp.]